ncbi:hypothetical protein [Pantoea sp. SGAir0180]
MQFDPQIVSHAQAFVNARRNGKRARVPAMQVRQWPFFIALVNAASASRDVNPAAPAGRPFKEWFMSQLDFADFFNQAEDPAPRRLSSTRQRPPAIRPRAPHDEHRDGA